MGNKWRTVAALVIIIALAWVELQQYSEAADVAEQTRKLAHMLFLLAIAVVGYWGWFTHPVKWLKNAWLLSYSAVMAILIAVGVIHMKVYPLSSAFLDEMSLLRIFFSSPVPFLVLLVFQIRKKEAVEQG